MKPPTPHPRDSLASDVLASAHSAVELAVGIISARRDELSPEARAELRAALDGKPREDFDAGLEDLADDCAVQFRNLPACPACGSSKSAIRNSRLDPDGSGSIREYHACADCGNRFVVIAEPPAKKIFQGRHFPVCLTPIALAAR